MGEGRLKIPPEAGERVTRKFKFGTVKLTESENGFKLLILLY
jgi:hypothetical protein